MLVLIVSENYLRFRMCMIESSQSKNVNLMKTTTTTTKITVLYNIECDTLFTYYNVL